MRCMRNYSGKGRIMRIASVAPLAAAAFAAFGVAGGPAFADADRKVSGPHVHENLAIYFIHGTSADGPGAADVGRGAREWPRAGDRDRPRQRAADREHRRRGGLRPGRRHREGRQAGSRAHGQPGAAAEIGHDPHRLVLRGARPLVGARCGGSCQVHERNGLAALAQGARDHGGAAERRAAGR